MISRRVLLAIILLLAFQSTIALFLPRQDEKGCDLAGT